MSVNTVPYPFQFDSAAPTGPQDGTIANIDIRIKNTRGKIPSLQAARLRTMMLEARDDPTKILAHACTYDGLSSRLVEEAGFPMVFLAGYAVASSYGLPDTGYIAMAEMCDKIQEAVRQVSVPVMADGDTGYGSPMNVKRTVESFAAAGAAGVMIEDQRWPKRCGHTKGKDVVSREEAYARIKAAVDARNEGRDIFILARTDALMYGWDEAMTRAKEFMRIGVDAIFVEALPDREAMKRCVKEISCPVFANIIEGGKTENISAKELAELGYSAVAYPWTLVAAHLKSVREALDGLKRSMTVGAPPMILTYDEVCEGVGFNKYWMVSTTRGQHFARRRTLRSWQHWKPFVSPAASLRKHTFRKSHMMQHLHPKDKNAPVEVISRLPFEVLEKIILSVDANTILVQCQRVLGTRLYHSDAIQQALGFQPPSRSSSIWMNPFKDTIYRCVLAAHHKELRETCRCWYIENTDEDLLNIIVRVEAS
ncbi:Carboxyvinyl-carboxyphosphonate phosphorylmutase [Penicillium subrubescens]|uniref:Carboxyvinyl-carboxyphosphonate phosphorylmutase n=1 Tax=Penicillium subrubescens TaxID=1316194 RepID=A0A1Q5UHJ8_9EURO|nr:Carboxyvinyl-carboxyphosphonate phosphorylmutase [Penicillium subrubescens]